MNNKELLAREKFEQRITKGMLGPGSDTWGLPEAEEIISDYPLLRYFTGVLFPERKEPDNQIEADRADVESETSEEEDAEETEEVRTEDKEADADNDDKNSKIKDADYEKISQNHFFPNNIGITICVDKTAENIEAEFSFGVYYPISNDQIEKFKIKISEKGYKSFFDKNIPFQLPFKEKLKYEDGFIRLQEKIEGNAGGRGKERSGDYKDFDEFKKRENLKKSEARKYINILDQLISRKWKREEIIIKKKIKTEDTFESVKLALPFKSDKELSASYNVKTFDYEDKKYIKIQLINSSAKHPRNKFSNKNEKLNSKCLFQTKIKIISDNILPYKDHKERFLFDDEAKQLNFIYRNIKNYGIGHNCSVTWQKDASKTIETDFLPKVNIKDIKNMFDFKDALFDKALVIKNISNFGLEKEEIIKSIEHFILVYKNWIEEQKKEKDKLDVTDKKIAEDIINKQEEIFLRLKANIKILQDNNTAFEAFKLANTAMFIQLIISNDKDFAKEEKELSQLNIKIKYNDLDFFKNYDYSRLTFGVPKYRPFQLAFLLLIIDGIVDKNSKYRKDILDLIWFPTGGGKTEAYLAAAAFTMIFRRLNNKEGYKGTNVIMRYTLRLLTSQQFERASGLIAVLEFLRNQKKFNEILKEEPFTIGLWVGAGSTPNRLKDAKKVEEEIDKECDREGDPASKNAFNISSCPWCGTKIISKDENNKWDYGFTASKKDFIIYCLNKKCPFHKRMPVQVIDEALYENPPTLLFGTVDKFAMLAWQEQAYKFFNTDNKKYLQPDLIIQDELHLLNGPLGSIVGIFESVIELLSSKNGVPPKIIASTATTRNTENQVKNLYGNRTVNIFPASGINYNDSFFAKEDKENSKREYIGFIPTGKTSIDTQLQMLSHLLIARLEIYTDSDLKDTVDNYWTIVSYYNSLKDVGRIYNKVGDEIKTFTGNLQLRLSELFGKNPERYSFNYNGILSRTKELTSRIDSKKIKTVLKELEKEFNKEKIIEDEKGRRYLNNIIDLVLATNMFSVGIDINRLNIMLINGMPKNIAEFIQASSRVGRSVNGLVITLFDANRAREKSYFEHFKPFLTSFYKNVEPLSVTPFTENAIKKMLHTIIAAFVRQYYPGELNKNKQAGAFTKDKIEPLIDFIKKRFSAKNTAVEYFENEINRITDDWVKRIKGNESIEYKELLKKPKEKTGDSDDWVVMQSMREVDTNTFIQIKECK